MNLSPEWVGLVVNSGYQAIHWSEVGKHDAPDTEIMEWADREKCVVFTHDLDFGALLYSTKARSPSVIQIRMQDIRPKTAGTFVLQALDTTKADLKNGALVTIDPRRMRISSLPLR
jgi:predicted nuclease of predicted toxin-antitoxin system